MSIPGNSEYYRERANKLREAATAPLSAEDHDTLVSFAEQFDKFADEAELSAQAPPRDK
jgi:hypothetical protein